MSYDLKNSKYPLSPAINGTVTFRPDGRGGFTPTGSRDAFPALEAYLHRGGTVAKIVQRPERRPFHLMPIFPNHRWP